MQDSGLSLALRQHRICAIRPEMLVCLTWSSVGVASGGRYGQCNTTQCSALLLPLYHQGILFEFCQSDGKCRAGHLYPL